MAEAKQQAPSTYTVAELMANAKVVFGVKREIVTGALYDVVGPITVEDAKTRVKSFLEKEVK